MNRVTLLLTVSLMSLVVLTAPVAAQIQDASQSPGKITGVVRDSATKETLDYARIIVKTMNNGKLISGALSKSGGKFTVDRLKEGEVYLVEITYIGYSPKRIDSISLRGNPPTLDLGEVFIAQKDVSGQTVEVVGKKEFMENRIDKKVFNLTGNPIAVGSSVSDVLSKLPSVEVDQDGNISIRGKANVQILVDGRPLPMTNEQLNTFLKQLPAQMVDNIEVITNPSAKYDASGMSGIINIEMKKNTDKVESYGGGITLGIGTDDKYNALINGNYKNDGLSAFLSYGYSKMKYGFDLDIYRETRSADNTPNSYMFQDAHGDNTGNNHNVNLRLDYAPDAQNTFSISGMYNNYAGPTSWLSKYDFDDSSKSLVNYSERMTSNESSNKSATGSLYYKYQFAKDHALTADFSYSWAGTDDDQQYRTINYSTDRKTEVGSPIIQNDILYLNSKTFTPKLDYSLPVDSSTKLEAGYKGEFRTIDNSTVSRVFVDSTQQWVSNTANTNSLRYTDGYHAGYAMVTRDLTKDFTAQAGLRVEQTIIDGTYQDGGSVNRKFLDLFPSASMMYKLDDASQLQLSYSRRISRPSFFQLVPYNNRYDAYSRWTGNPDLTPEYTDAVELGYSTGGSFGSLNVNPYLRFDHDPIRYTQSIINGVAVSRPENFNGGTSYGLDVSGSARPVQMLYIILNGSLYNIQNDGSQIAGDVASNGIGWSANGTLIAYLSKSTEVNINSRYRSAVEIGSSRREPGYSTDVSFTQRLLENNLIISLRFSDIFDTQQFGYTATGDGFASDFTMKGKSRMIFLNVTYNFGQRIRMQRRDQPQQQRRPDDGGMGGFGM